MGSAALCMFSFIALCMFCLFSKMLVPSSPLLLVVVSSAQQLLLPDFQAQTLSVVLALTLVLFFTPALELVLGLH